APSAQCLRIEYRDAADAVRTIAQDGASEALRAHQLYAADRGLSPRRCRAADDTAPARLRARSSIRSTTSPLTLEDPHVEHETQEQHHRVAGPRRAAPSASVQRSQIAARRRRPRDRKG